MTNSWDDLVLDAGHQASQDFDAWVLKLGTAGFTLVLGVAALVRTESFKNLVLAGFLFAAALMAGLLSLRLSADGLIRLSDDDTLDREDVWQFTGVLVMNWVAFVALSAAFLMLAAFVGMDAVPRTDGG